MNKALNYENILLKHGKCVVNSRKECDISTFIAGKKATTPVFCANMPAVINQDICKMFDDAGWFHVYHRLGGNSDIIDYVINANSQNWNYVSISVGVKQDDIELLAQLKGYRIDAITIDIAFSWQDKVVSVIKYIKDNFPNTWLIVGNGDHPDWIKWLEDLGVDIAKINIGTSKACFEGDTLVKTFNGYKKIKNIKIGDIVLTHTGEYCVVEDTIKKYSSHLIDINGIICTKEHKFYVIKKENFNVVNENNIHRYAFWLEAENITEDHFLIEID